MAFIPHLALTHFQWVEARRNWSVHMSVHTCMLAPRNWKVPNQVAKQEGEDNALSPCHQTLLQALQPGAAAQC